MSIQVYKLLKGSKKYRKGRRCKKTGGRKFEREVGNIVDPLEGHSTGMVRENVHVCHPTMLK